MTIFKLSINWGYIIRVFLLVICGIFFIFTLVLTYILGLVSGYRLGQNDTENFFLSYISEEYVEPRPQITVTLTPTRTVAPKQSRPIVEWGGPELWEAVNAKRVEFGVNPLKTKSELCTIASIRLNELLDLGKLDNHEGFSNLSDRRPDLKWIFDNYSTIAEFLAVGGKSPEETVSLWQNTLGHKKLLDGGEFVWGCVYSQNTFSVAIAAY